MFDAMKEQDIDICARLPSTNLKTAKFSLDFDYELGTTMLFNHRL